MTDMKGTFTPFNTVVFDDGTEILNKKYFKKLEKGILKDRIRYSSYNFADMTFSYSNYKSCPMINYTLDTEKCTPEVIAEINRLVSLENNRRLAEKMKREAEDRQRKQNEEDEKLITEASKGNIVSERARQLYLDKLNNELKYLGKFELLKCSENNNAFTVIAKSITWLETCFFGFFGFWGLILTPGLVVLVFAIKAGINIYYQYHGKTSITSRFLAAIPMNIMKTFKFFTYRKKRELIRNKINWLENYNLTGEEIIETNISRINTMIRGLDEENRIKFEDELKLEIQKYHTSLIKAATNGLSIDNQEYARLNFSSYLATLEYRIVNVKNGASYESTVIKPVDHSMDLASDVKVRKLENSSMAMPM